MKCDMTWPSRLGLHGAPPMVLRVYGATFASDNIKLTVTMSYVKQPHCKTKLDALLLSFCMFYVAARAFVKRTVLTYEYTTITAIK